MLVARVPCSSRIKKSPAVSFEIRGGFLFQTIELIFKSCRSQKLEFVSYFDSEGIALDAGAVPVLVSNSIGHVASSCFYSQSTIPAACVGDVEAEGISCSVQADFVCAVTVAEGPYVACFCHRTYCPVSVLQVCAVADAEREEPQVRIIAVMAYAKAVGVGISAEVQVTDACERGDCALSCGKASFSSDSDAVCIAVSGAGDGLAGVLLGEIIAAMQVGDVAEVSHSALFDSAIESEAVVVSIVFCMSSCGVAGEVSIYIGECCASGCAAILVEVAADDNAIELCVIGSADVGKAEAADIFLGVDVMSPEILILVFSVETGQVGSNGAVEEVVSSIKSMLYASQLSQGCSTVEGAFLLSIRRIDLIIGCCTDEVCCITGAGLCSIDYIGSEQVVINIFRSLCLGCNGELRCSISFSADEFDQLVMRRNVALVVVPAAA